MRVRFLTVRNFVCEMHFRNNEVMSYSYDVITNEPFGKFGKGTKQSGFHLFCIDAISIYIRICFRQTKNKINSNNVMT